LRVIAYIVNISSLLYTSPTNDYYQIESTFIVLELGSTSEPTLMEFFEHILLNGNTRHVAQNCIDGAIGTHRGGSIAIGYPLFHLGGQKNSPA
jgi:hypothetical protein